MSEVTNSALFQQKIKRYSSSLKWNNARHENKDQTEAKKVV